MRTRSNYAHVHKLTRYILPAAIGHRALLFYRAVFRVLVPVRSAIGQKRSLSKITDFMTGSSRKEREEGDVDCVPPPPKRSCHRGTFDTKWTDEFPWVVNVPADRKAQRCVQANGLAYDSR